MNNNFQNTNETFGGISKKFLARLVAIIIEKISDRTLTVQNNLLKISGPQNVLIKNNGNNNTGLFVDISNNVGIGTSTPSYKLHLLGDMKIEGDFFIKGTTYTVDTGNQVTDAIIVTNHDTETALTVNMVGSYPIVEYKNNNQLVSILTSSGCLGIGINTPEDKLEVNGFIKAINGYKINDTILFDANINATFPGTLDISKNFTINMNMFKVIANTGDIITKGKLLVYDDTILSKNVSIIGILNINDSKFIVYTDGTIEMQGNLKINNNKFIVESISGNTTILGILNLLNDLNINNKFIVDHNTGDTQISGSVDIYENLNVNNILIVDNLNKNVIINENIDISKNLNISGNLNINGSVNFNANFNVADKFTIQNSGDVLMSGELRIANKILLNTDKFIVDISGNINSCGKLTILDNFNINNNKFSINALNGDVYIDNILIINNKLFINNINDNIIFNNNIININKQIDLLKSFNINTNKFNVDYSSGNVNIAGTLDVLNNSHFFKSVIIDKDLTVNENTYINGYLQIEKNTYLKENIKIDKSLNINDYFIINSLTKQISFGIINPLYNVDISGNMRIDNIMINKNLGFNGYLFKMDNIYNPSIKFKTFTNDYNVYNYETSIITLTNENYPLVKSVIEFDIDYYIPQTNLRYIKITFDLYINSSKLNNNGNGFSISLFNSISCNTLSLDDLNYNVDLSGYTIYLNIVENMLQLYSEGNIIDEIKISNLISNNYHNCKLIITNNIIVFFINDNQIYSFENINKIGKLFTFGGWTTSYTITQKIKNIELYVEYDECKKKLQVLGESFLKETTINGNLKCNGFIQLDGPITTENNKLNILKKIDLNNDLILSGNLLNNGILIDMNNIDDFNYDTYLIGNDFNYDISNNEIKLTENIFGNIQSIIDFNLNEYIDNNILNEFIFELDYLSSGHGIWFYFYNENKYLNSYLAYIQEINGYSIFINNKIHFYEKANEIYNFDYSYNVNNWQHLFIQVKNNYLLFKINDFEYINTLYYNFKYKGNHFGIGGLNGLQKVKNIKISGKINTTEKKLSIFGNSIIKGNFKVSGNTKYLKDVNINGNLYVNNNTNINDVLLVDKINTNINNNLNINGNINFTGNIYQNGTLLDITTQNPIKWIENNNNYYTELNIAIGKSIPNYKLDVLGNINCTNGLYINDNLIIDNNGRIVSTSYIPYLNATKINSGIFDITLIPEMSTAKITSGVFASDRIPELNASIITSGKLNNNILPHDIDISGNITANNYINLPFIGNTIVINSNYIKIQNPFNTTNISVTANIQSSILQNITIQIGEITKNEINFFINGSIINTCYIHYLIYKI